MRYFVLLIFAVSFYSCMAERKDIKAVMTDSANIEKLKIAVGSTVFTATLVDNETVTAFKTMLPLTVSMTELNGNEKYYHLSKNLPANSSNPGKIHSGDLMLFGGNSLVLFYKTFSTSYSYTKLGKIDDPSGLATALGSGNATVSFELIRSDN